MKYLRALINVNNQRYILLGFIFIYIYQMSIVVIMQR